MGPISISTSDRLGFKLTKEGGAKMTCRISVFKLGEKPEPVRRIFMGAGTSKTETPPSLDPLDAGTYQIVAVTVVEEAVSGTYTFNAELNGKGVADGDGDVNTAKGLDVEVLIERTDLIVA